MEGSETTEEVDMKNIHLSTWALEHLQRESVPVAHPSICWGGTLSAVRLLRVLATDYHLSSDIPSIMGYLLEPREGLVLSLVEKKTIGASSQIRDSEKELSFGWTKKGFQ